MRASLLGAFTRLALFWWVVPLLVWSWGHPERVERALGRLAWLREIFGLGPVFDGEVTVLNDAMALAALLGNWTLPVLVAAALFITVGIALAAISVRMSLKSRVERVLPGAPWRQAAVSRGSLPLPPYPIQAVPAPQAPPEDETAAAYDSIVLEVLGFAEANPKAYCPESDGSSLHGYMRSLAEKAGLLGLSPVERAVLVCHLAGNPEAYRFDKGDGSWALVRPTGANAARIVSACPAWFRLPARDRSVLTLAVKYFGAPGSLPRLGSDHTAHEAALALIVGAQAALAAPWPEPVEPVAPEVVAVPEEPVAVEPVAVAPVPAAVSAQAETNARPQVSTTPTAAAPSLPPTPAIAVSPKALQPERSAAMVPPAKVAEPVAKPAVPPTASATANPSVPAATVPRAQAKPQSAATAPSSAPAAAVAPGFGAPAVRTLAPEELPAAALRVLMDGMYRLPFQAPGIQKGTRAAGFKRGRRIYLLDAQVRGRLLVNLAPELAAAFIEEDRPKGQLFTFTRHLCKALLDEGWLVTKIDDMVVSKKSPLWRVRSGTSEFTGVIVLDWPEEHAHMLPASDTTYELAVLGPQFAESEFIDSGVMGALFR